MDEVLLVDTVHLGEVVHGGKEDVDLDDLGDVAAGILEDALQALAAGLGLIGDAALNEVAGGIGGDLTRDPDLTGGLDGLGVRAHG